MKKWLLGLMGVSVPFFAQAQIHLDNDIKTYSSTYMSNCSSRSIDCTKTVASMCDGYNACFFSVTNSLCGDPEPSCTKKHLQTIYICPDNSSATSVNTPEGSVQHLKCQ